MSDPISGAGGGAAKLALQQLQQMQQQQQLQKPSINPAGGQQSAFANKMQQTQQTQQAQQVAETQKVNQSIRPQKIRPTDMQQTQRVQGTQKGEAARFGRTTANQSSKGLGAGIAQFMQKVDSRKSSLDSMVKKALSGKTFNNKELLVLQYRVSQFSMEMDLTSKVVDKTTGGIKQAMNTQV